MQQEDLFMRLIACGKKNGSYRWAIDKGTPRYDENGNYAGMIGTVTDVHDQYLAEAKTRETLETNEIKFRSLVEEAPVATCLFTGPDMMVEVANDRDAGFLGKNPGCDRQTIC